MTEKEFNAILEDRLKKIKKVLGSKAKEYASGDRLYNFKRASKIIGDTPLKALLGMFSKHLVSVLDLIEGKLERTDAMIDEKIGDSINYLILLEALLRDVREKE